MKSRQVRTRSRANDLSGRASSSRRVRFVSSSVVDCGSWVLRLVVSGEVSVPSATLVCSSRERSWLSPALWCTRRTVVMAGVIGLSLVGASVRDEDDCGAFQFKGVVDGPGCTIVEGNVFYRFQPRLGRGARPDRPGMKQRERVTRYGCFRMACSSGEGPQAVLCWQVLSGSITLAVRE